MSSLPRPLKAAGVVYTPETGRRSLLGDFAAELRRRGFSVGGVIQEPLFDAEGNRIGIDTVDIANGRRVPIARPTRAELDAGTCSLNTSALAESTAALRSALSARCDLVVVEKFGEREQMGKGLADEILACIAEGIPTLVAVPGLTFDGWVDFSGGMASVLPWREGALWRWWGADNLYRDLAHAVGDDAGTVRKVVVGFNWTLVEGPHGCGIAQTPPRPDAGCHALKADRFIGRPLAEVAALAGGFDAMECAIGLAAINAALNRSDLEVEDINGLDAFAGIDGPVGVIGRFPGLAQRMPGAMVVERQPAEGEFPEHAAPKVLASSVAAVITASTLVNGSLPGLLDARGPATRIAIVGPGTPLTPRLFDYGPEVLSGLVIDDAEGAARAVAQGCGARDLRAFGRNATLRRRQPQS